MLFSAVCLFVCTVVIHLSRFLLLFFLLGSSQYKKETIFFGENKEESHLHCFLLVDVTGREREKVHSRLFCYSNQLIIISGEKGKGNKQSFTTRAMAGEISQQVRLIEEVTHRLSLILMDTSISVE